MYKKLTDPQLQTAWNNYISQAETQGESQAGQKLTITVLIHVVHLVEIFKKWTKGATNPDHYPMVWPPGHSMESFHCIAGYVTPSTTLDSMLLTWRTGVDNFCTGFDGANNERVLLAIKPAHRLPGFMMASPSPPAPPAETTRRKQGQQGDPNKKEDKKQKPRRGHNPVQFLASTTPKNISQDQQKAVLDRAVEWSNPNHQPYSLQYNGKPICFHAIIGGIKNCSNEQCQKVHIDLEKHKPKQKTLKPLMDYLLDPESQNLRATSYFKEKYELLEK